MHQLSVKTRHEKKYHTVKRHSKATARVVREFKICDKDFHSFHFLRGHKQKKHGEQRGSVAQNVDALQLMGNVEDNSLQKELETCKRFLVDNEMENARHRVYNFAMDTVDPKNLLAKLDVVFDSLKCAAKQNVAFSFVLKNLEDKNSR